MFNLLAVVGPTASGKTSLAVKLAAEFHGEIISADSRQVYRGMDLGTGKDLEEYVADGVPVPYHLIDVVDAGYKYNIFEYQQDFLKIWDDCRDRKVLPVLCGGSGLYVETVLKGYQLIAVPVNEELRVSLSGFTQSQLAERLATYKKLHNTTEVDTCKRAIRAIEIEEYYRTHPLQEVEMPAIHPLIVGVDVSREVRRERITARLYERLHNGMVEEVRRLLDNGIPADDLIYYGLEYKFITLYLIGQLSYEQMFEQLNTAIHQFAKRQMTWFRKMEKDGFVIRWLAAELSVDEKIEQVKQWWLEKSEV